MRRTAAVLALTVAAMTGTTSALAYWTRAGAGAGSSSTTTINPPAVASAAGDSASTVRVTVDTAPSTGAPVHGYRVDRTLPTALNGACFITASTGSCSAPADGTGTQTYRVTSYRGSTALQYWQSTPLAGVTGTPTSSLTITDVVRNAGNTKVKFTGTGAVSSTQITVTVCKANSFPCSGPNTADTITYSPPSAGSWTTGQGNSLTAGTSYYARAVQGSSTSAVFSFTG
jgi:hypothetical protein